jgi:hypothetical protein
MLAARASRRRAAVSWRQASLPKERAFPPGGQGSLWDVRCVTAGLCKLGQNGIKDELKAYVPGEPIMSEDKRDVLEVLRYELNFLEQGGYGNWYSTPWGPASIFQDSLTCPNHGDPTRPHACHECLLYDFVPEEYRTEDVPCHHIPLNRSGVTVATPNQTEEELRENVKHWLKRTIARIEADRAKQSQPAKQTA